MDGIQRLIYASLKSVNYGASITIFTLSKHDPNHLLYHQKIPYLLIQVTVLSQMNINQQKPSNAPNDKPNSLKHHKHIVPKLKETQSFYQTVGNACQFNSTKVCPG